MSFKRFLITFAGFLFVSAFAFADNAQRLTEGVDFFVDGDHIVIRSARDAKEIYIPSEMEVDGIVYPVTEIYENAFREMGMLETLHLPATVNIINMNAFKGTAVRELYIDDLESWCKMNFMYNFNAGITYWSADCASNPINRDTKLYVGGEPLGDVLTIPSGVEAIPAFAFQRLNITKLITGDDCEEIDIYAFHESGIKEVEFGEKVKYICGQAFLGTKIQKVTFKSSLAGGIGEVGVGSLQEVHVPSLEAWMDMPFVVSDLDETSYWSDYKGGFIGHQYSLFVNGKHVEDLVIPEGTEEIKPLTFEGTDIKTVSLPSTLRKIGAGAFRKSTLRSIVIPESVESDMRSTFRECEFLESVEFKGDRVSSPMSHTFRDCISLTTVLFNGIMYDPDLLYCFGAFQNCSSLEEITIPEGVQRLSDVVFSDCVSLRRIIFPSTLESLTDWTFLGCKKVESIEFESVLPPLMNIYFEPAKHDFSVTGCTLYVPQGCYQTYRDDPYWGEFLNIEETALSAGIENIAPEMEATDAVYDLYGWQVDPSNLSKGIYIRNGKKFMVK